MYINKSTKIILIIAIIILNSCSEPEDGPYIPYNKYLDGNIRSFDMLNDTLFVASEDEGIMIYEIINDNDKISLDSMFLSNEVNIPVTLDITENSRSLIVLDDYNHTYIGKPDFFVGNSFLSSITCDDYQRKSAFIDYSDRPIELITPFRHKPTQNEVDSLAWDTSFLHRVTFDQQAYDLNVYSGDCSDTLYKYLNYDIEDVYYNDEKLYLVNPEEDDYSVIVLDHDSINNTFTAIDTLILDSKPITIKTINSYVFIGLDNNGCYIKLLDTGSTNDSNFYIAPGYTIQDIQLSDNYITLSAGYGGSLIYQWDEPGIIGDEDLLFLLSGIYAYKTVMYGDNIIVGTKDGLHIYEIER